MYTSDESMIAPEDLIGTLTASWHFQIFSVIGSTDVVTLAYASSSDDLSNFQHNFFSTAIFEVVAIYTPSTTHLSWLTPQRSIIYTQPQKRAKETFYLENQSIKS